MYMSLHPSEHDQDHSCPNLFAVFQIKPKIPSHLTLNDIDRGQSVSAKDPVRRWTRSVETRRYSFVDADISRILKVVVKVLVKIYYILPAVNELREIIRLKMS